MPDAAGPNGDGGRLSASDGSPITAAELRAAGLRAPGAGVFVLERALELGDAVILDARCISGDRRAERARERDELGAVRKLAGCLPVAVLRKASRLPVPRTRQRPDFDRRERRKDLASFGV